MHFLLKTLLLPPVGLFWLVLAGLLAWRRRWARRLGLAAVAALLAMSLPLVSNGLMRGLEPYPPLDPAAVRHPDVDAIVVLGAGRYTGAPEYGGDTLGSLTLQRVRYGAWLQRRSGLPLVVSAGSPPDESPPLARLMARTLREEFQVPVALVEDRSRTTRQNARFTAELLRRRGWQRVWLVSHAWHLPRAVAAFRQAGIQAIPAPTAFDHHDEPEYELYDFLPAAWALNQSYFALHERIGRLWYLLLDRLEAG